MSNQRPLIFPTRCYKCLCRHRHGISSQRILALQRSSPTPLQEDLAVPYCSISMKIMCFNFDFEDKVIEKCRQNMYYTLTQPSVWLKAAVFAGGKWHSFPFVLKSFANDSAHFWHRLVEKWQDFTKSQPSAKHLLPPGHQSKSLVHFGTIFQRNRDGDAWIWHVEMLIWYFR